MPSAGDDITYAFTVTNTGNVTLSNLIVTDPLVTVAGGPLASLAPAAVDASTFSAVYTLTQADIDAGSLLNTATVAGSSGTTTVTATDTDLQTFAHAPAMTLTKSLAGGQSAYVQVGETATFTITITNTGNTTITSGSVVDSWNPADLTFASATPAPGQIGSDSATFTVPTLGVGDSASFDVSFVVVGSGLLMNRADSTGVADTFGTSVPDMTDTATLQVTTPKVSADKALAPGSDTTVTVGEDIGFTLTVANSGDTTITSADVVDSWDAALLQFSSASPAPTATTANSATFSFTDIAPGQTRSVDVTLTGLAAGTTANVMTIHGVDIHGDSVSATDSVPVVVIPVTHPALTLTKSLAAGQDPHVQVGQAVRYVIEAANSGDTTIAAGTVRDTWNAAELTYTGAAPAPSTHGPGSATFNLPTPLSPGSTATITIDFTVASQPVAGAISNFATTADVVDSLGATVAPSGDNALVNVTAPALAVTKMLAPWQSSWVVSGQPVAFRMTFTNTGDTTITTLPALDTYDASALSFSAASSAPTTATAGLLQWANLGPIGPGESRTLDTTFTAGGVPTSHRTTNTLSVTGAEGRARRSAARRRELRIGQLRRAARPDLEVSQ